MNRPNLALLVYAAAMAAEPGMVFLPGGEFTRGRTHDEPDMKLTFYPNPLKDDLPVRRIYLKPFYLDAAEVTIGEYAAFVVSTHRDAPPVWPLGRPPSGKSRLPVAEVSWHDASAYCTWRGKRLPTEAEWERACRGLTDQRIYPWGDEPPANDKARYDTLEGPVNTCSFPRSTGELCDMAGNVWEWTADWYGRDYYATAPEKNPHGPATGLYRVLRGGSWFDVKDFLTCAHRTWARPIERSPNIGFRCALDFPPRQTTAVRRSGSK